MTFGKLAKEDVDMLKEKVDKYEFCYVITNKVFLKKDEYIYICNINFDIKYKFPVNGNVLDFIECLIKME